MQVRLGGFADHTFDCSSSSQLLLLETTAQQSCLPHLKSQLFKCGVSTMSLLTCRKQRSFSHLMKSIERAESRRGAPKFNASFKARAFTAFA